MSSQMFYMFLVAILALAIESSIVTDQQQQQQPCVNAECRSTSVVESPEYYEYVQRFLADRQKMKRDYDFVRFGRSGPAAKKASYDYIRFGRK